MQSRNQQSASLCEFADRLERAATVLFSRISEHTSASQWEACRIALWSFYQELLGELKERGRFHYSSPAGSLHYCLAQAYQDAKAKLDILEQTHLSPPPAPPRRVPPRNPDAVVNDIASLADEVKRPGDTYLGWERTPDTGKEGTK
jgi:hypothetical protein